MREKTVELQQLMPLVLQQLENGSPVQFTPGGTSMRPMLEGGRDQVILSPLPPRLKKYDLPLYQRDNGHYVLHRIVKAGETYTCMGDNQFVPEPNLRQEQMLAVVTGFVRKGRSVSVDCLSYRIYCRLWHYSRPLRRLLRRVRNRLRRRL